MNRGLLFGEGFFETIRWSGENKRLVRHYQRLKNSCQEFGLLYPSYEEFIKTIKKEVGERRDVYVKFLLYFKGSDYFADYPSEYECKVFVKTLPKVPSSVRLTFSSYLRHSLDPVCRHKTISYLFNVLVKRQALSKGFYDAIIVNERYHLCETSSSNLLFVKGSKLYTPARENGLLWGTTISILFERMDVKEEHIKNIEEFESVFVTNALVGCVPVESIEGFRFKVDASLQEELLRVIEYEQREHT